MKLEPDTKPYYQQGKYFVSPFNYASEVKNAAQFKEPFRIYDSTIRKTYLCPGTKVEIRDLFVLAEQLEAAGVKHSFSMVHWFTEDSRPEPIEYEMVRSLVRDFSWETTVCATDGMKAGDWRARLDYLLELEPAWIQLNPYLPYPIYDADLSRPSGSTFQESLEKTLSAVEHIRDAGVQCSVTVRDCGRADWDSSVEMLNAVLSVGAARVDLQEGPSSLSPHGVQAYMRALNRVVRDRVPITLHPHNDSGFANANAVIAAAEGAWLDLSAMGISDHSGFASLEMVAATLEAMYGVDTGIDIPAVTKVAQWIADNVVPSTPLRPVVGGHHFLQENPHRIAQVLQPDAGHFSPPETALLPGMFGKTMKVVWERKTVEGTNALRAKLLQVGVEPTDANMQSLQNELRSELSRLSEYPRWLEDDDVTLVARRLFKSTEVGIPAVNA